MADITSTNSYTRVPTTDFIAPTTSHNPIEHSKHHRILLYNSFAQPETLAFGKSEEVMKQLGPDASDALIKSKVLTENLFRAQHPFDL